MHMIHGVESRRPLHTFAAQVYQHYLRSDRYVFLHTAQIRAHITANDHKITTHLHDKIPTALSG